MDQDNQTGMENQSNQSESMQTSTPEIGFPVPQAKPKKSGGRWIFLILGLVLLVGGIIFLVTRNNKMGTGEATPSPFAQQELQTPPAVEETEAPEASPAAKEDVSILVQNGTGITGEAGYLQGILKGLGYSDVSAENADTSDATETSVTFKSTLAQSVVNEITSKLKTIYESVTTDTTSTGSNDIVIITGLRKGATAKPAATTAASASPSASPTN